MRISQSKLDDSAAQKTKLNSIKNNTVSAYREDVLHYRKNGFYYLHPSSSRRQQSRIRYNNMYQVSIVLRATYHYYVGTRSRLTPFSLVYIGAAFRNPVSSYVPFAWGKEGIVDRKERAETSKAVTC